MSAREKTFREELDKLIEEGEKLYHGLYGKSYPQTTDENDQENINKHSNNPVVFQTNYQQWYSKSYIIIKQILPHRINDFLSYYEYSQSRDSIKITNYRIEDYLDGIKPAFAGNMTSSVRTHFQQQLGILKTAQDMLSSTLLDLKALIQAELFDSEIDIAKELAKKGFLAAAGAICGVIIEKHLLTLCQNHKIKIGKKHPTINDLCEPLKKEEIISQPDWRLIQYYADIRNLCCHNKDQEPTKEQVNDLINGTDKIIKTIS